MANQQCFSSSASLHLPASSSLFLPHPSLSLPRQGSLHSSLTVISGPSAFRLVPTPLPDVALEDALSPCPAPEDERSFPAPEPRSDAEAPLLCPCPRSELPCRSLLLDLPPEDACPPSAAFCFGAMRSLGVVSLRTRE